MRYLCLIPWWRTCEQQSSEPNLFWSYGRGCKHDELLLDRLQNAHHSLGATDEIQFNTNYEGLVSSAWLTTHQSCHQPRGLKHFIQVNSPTIVWVLTEISHNWHNILMNTINLKQRFTHSFSELVINTSNYEFQFYAFTFVQPRIKHSNEVLVVILW